MKDLIIVSLSSIGFIIYSIYQLIINYNSRCRQISYFIYCIILTIVYFILLVISLSSITIELTLNKL